MDGTLEQNLVPMPKNLIRSRSIQILKETQNIKIIKILNIRRFKYMLSTNCYPDGSRMSASLSKKGPSLQVVVVGRKIQVGNHAYVAQPCHCCSLCGLHVDDHHLHQWGAFLLSSWNGTHWILWRSSKTIPFPQRTFPSQASPSSSSSFMSWHPILLNQLRWPDFCGSKQADIHSHPAALLLLLTSLLPAIQYSRYAPQCLNSPLLANLWHNELVLLRHERDPWWDLDGRAYWKLFIQCLNPRSGPSSPPFSMLTFLLLTLVDSQRESNVWGALQEGLHQTTDCPICREDWTRI